jgi:divalent metal cation (Fe/Co/Zn/Cd) transporter
VVWQLKGEEGSGRDPLSASALVIYGLREAPRALGQAIGSRSVRRSMSAQRRGPPVLTSRRDERSDPNLGGRGAPVDQLARIGLSISSLILMPLLGAAKQRVAAGLGSATTAGEGTQNLLCAYLAAGVLAGLLANILFGAWWLDPVVALAISGLALREGYATWRGENCCADMPFPDRCEHEGCA